MKILHINPPFWFTEHDAHGRYGYDITWDLKAAQSVRLEDDYIRLFYQIHWGVKKVCH